MAGPLQAVTFDFWNTLVRDDSGAARGRRVDAWMGLLEGEGAALEREAINAAFAESFEIFQRHWKDNLAYDAVDAVNFVLGRLALDPPSTLRDELVAALTDPRPEHDPALTDNVAACLARLKERGVRIGIICDVGLTPSRTLRRFLDGHGVLGHFDHWSFSDEVGTFKPDPVIFRHAMAGLGVDDPATMAHIGDLRRTDVLGSNAMGMTSVRYAGVFDDEADPLLGIAGEADHTIADHADLPEVLGLA